MPGAGDGQRGVVLFEHGFDRVGDLRGDLDISEGRRDGLEPRPIEADGQALAGFALVLEGGCGGDGSRAPFWLAGMDYPVAEGELVWAWMG